MARSHKTSLLYFTHDVDMADDTKIRVLRARHGITGYAVYCLLLETIYRGSGYYHQVTPEWLTIFAADCRLSEHATREIIADMARIGLFHNGLYSDERVLTSARIQTTYVDACERRVTLEFRKQLLLINPHAVKRARAKWKLLVTGEHGNPLFMQAPGMQETVNEKKTEKEKKEKQSKGHGHAPSGQQLSWYNLFCATYAEATGIPFVTTAADEDEAAINAVALVVLANAPRGATEDEQKECLRVFFASALRVNDAWLRNRFTPRLLAKKLNEYVRAMHNTEGVLNHGTKHGHTIDEFFNSIGLN